MIYLQRTVEVVLEELDEAGQDAGLDDLVDGRVGLAAQQLAELLRSLELLLEVIAVQRLDHLRSDGGCLRRVPALLAAQRQVHDVPALQQLLLAPLLAQLHPLLFAPPPHLLGAEAGALEPVLVPAHLYCSTGLPRPKVPYEPRRAVAETLDRPLSPTAAALD